MDVLVTGADGFVGRNLCVALSAVPGVRTLGYDLDSRPADLDLALGTASVVFHLAGVNRPADTQDFQRVNADLTDDLSRRLTAQGRSPTIVFASSTQATLDNPYGRSKLAAEEALRRYSGEADARVVVHRLKNLFGKWGRPNYNSVTATFCHNIAHGLPVQISNPANEVDLTYIDDVVASFITEVTPLRDDAPGFRIADPLPSHRITLGKLAGLIESFHDHRRTLAVPDFSVPLVRALYATYLSYLDTTAFSYALPIRSDDRGSLAEFVKGPAFGQVFVSRTNPGVTRGNHHHRTKTEKFLVVQGEALIRLRQVLDSRVIEVRVTGEEYRVVDIPPGFTHSIENIGSGELVTLFWACEVFDPGRPDTHPLPVLTGSDTP